VEGTVVSVGDTTTLVRVLHDVGRRYTVVGGVIVHAASLRLDGADATSCDTTVRNPDSPITEKGFYDRRRALVNKARLKVWYSHRQSAHIPTCHVTQVGNLVLCRIDGVWTERKITMVEFARAEVVASYRVPSKLVVHKRSVFLGQRAVRAARQHGRWWGAGMAAPAIAVKQERHLIPPGTAEHLQDWIFRFDFVEVLKMTGRNIEG
jgi:hypothetical protein